MTLIWAFLLLFAALALLALGFRLKGGSSLLSPAWSALSIINVFTWMSLEVPVSAIIWVVLGMAFAGMSAARMREYEKLRQDVDLYIKLVKRETS